MNMKKSLLLAAAALIAVSASAQMRVQQKPTVVKEKAIVNTHFQKVLYKEAKQFTGARSTAATPSKIRPVDAPKYLRPAGAFYAMLTPDFGWYGKVMLLGKPYSNYEFKNVSEVPATDWTYSLIESGANVEYTYQGQDFNHVYGYTNPSAPVLTYGDQSYDCTQMTEEVEGRVTVTHGAIWSGVNSGDFTSEGNNLLATPHYIFGTRFEDEDMGFMWGSYGVYGEDNSYWFGKNGKGWNGFGMAVEKPAEPYVLNKVYAFATNISIKGNVDLTCRVYRLPEMPQYSEDGAEIDPEIFNEDNLIATGTHTITPKDLVETTNLMLDFDLEAYDPEMEMSYQVTPEIDFPIIIVLTGQNSENVNTFTYMVSVEEEDEGWGENTFMLKEEEGAFTVCHGLDMFFALNDNEGMPLKVGPSIFMDVSMPFLTYNFDDETGEYTFPAEGGDYLSLGEYPGVYFYGVDQYSEEVTSENIYYSLEDGSDVPEWLTITLQDETIQQDGQTYVIPKALVHCDALPEGVEGREAKVKFYLNGAKLIYDFKQGNVVEPANKLYVIGDDPLGGWNPAAPIEMTENEETEGVFTYTVNVEEAKDIYFVFTEGIGSWAEVNGHRYGPTDADQDVVVGENMTTQLSSNDQAAYRLAAVAGEYTITFNKNTMTFRVDGEVAPEPDYKLHYGVEGAEWQDATFVPGEGENEGKLVAADVEFAANTEFKVNHGAEWYGGVAEEGEEAYLIHYGWCENIPLDLTGKNFRINEAGTYTFVLTIGEESKTLTVLGLVAPGVPGDSNGDGVVDIADVNSVINQMLGKEAMIPACDMNGDGVIDIADVNAVINKMLGK